MFTPPMVQLAENTSRAELKPARVEMSGLDTWLVMVWVSAMFRPCSMKNVPRVTRKLGMPVLTTIQPFRNPISRASASATNIPRSEEHTSELQSRENLVCRLLLEKKKKKIKQHKLSIKKKKKKKKH